MKLQGMVCADHIILWTPFAGVNSSVHVTITPVYEET